MAAQEDADERAIPHDLLGRRTFCSTGSPPPKAEFKSYGNAPFTPDLSSIIAFETCFHSGDVLSENTVRAVHQNPWPRSMA